MLRDLRNKLRTRHSRISSCGFQDFLPLTKQFFDFLHKSPILTSIITELLARNPTSANAARTVDSDSRAFGTTAEEAATIGYVTWKKFADQDHESGFHSFALSGDFNQSSGVYKDWYVVPFFDYLDEILDDANVILAMLTRYKHKVEWYRRREVLALYENDTGRGEKHLKQHMFEFLFDQGLPFHVEPTTASGKPDVVSLDDSDHPFVGEVKIFDPERGKGASGIKEAFSQVYRYCWDYNQPLGHLIVFNVSNKQLRVELPSTPDGIPRFEYNHKTIFLTVIDVHEHEGTASTRGIADTVTITAADLVHEVEGEVGQVKG